MTENHLKYDLHLRNLQFKQAWRSPSRRWQMILRSFLATRKFLYPNRIWLALPTTYPRPIGNPGKKGMSEKSWRGNQIKKRAGVRASQAILFIFHVFLSPLSCVHSFSFFLFFSKKAETLLTGKKKKNMFHLSNIFGYTPNQSKTLYLRQQTFLLFFVVLWIDHVSSSLGQAIWDGRILDLFMNISGGWQCLVEGNCT